MDGCERDLSHQGSSRATYIDRLTHANYPRLSDSGLEWQHVISISVRDRGRQPTAAMYSYRGIISLCEGS